jgi:hypothetical protein
MHHFHINKSVIFWGRGHCPLSREGVPLLAPTTLGASILAPSALDPHAVLGYWAPHYYWQFYVNALVTSCFVVILVCVCLKTVVARLIPLHFSTWSLKVTQTWPLVGSTHGSGWVGLGEKFLDFGGLGWVRNPYRSLATRFVRNEESVLHKVHSNSCALDPLCLGFYQ